MQNSRHFFLADTDHNISAALFDSQQLANECVVTGRKPAGRGEVVFFQRNSDALVLRHYCRGGLPARFNADKYCWSGIESTRAWREYRLLSFLQKRALPAPRAYAAHVEKRGLLYTCDIITHYIDDTETLGERLAGAHLSPSVFAQVGATIRRFHLAGVDHVDLNANNILLDSGDRVYLIDFDNCRLRDGARTGWQEANLRRLRRSLDKLCTLGGGYVDGVEWGALLNGYKRGGGSNLESLTLT